MNAYLLEYSIIQNKEEEFLSWLDMLNNKKGEVLLSLLREGINIESYFIDQKSKKISVYIMCENLQKSQDIFKNSQNELDKKHIDFIRTCLVFQRCLLSTHHYTTCKNNISEDIL